MKSKPFDNEKQLEQKLKQSLHQIPSVSNDAHLHTTILLAERESCQKQRQERISFARFLAKQTRFIGRKIWIVQGVSLFVMIVLIPRFYGDFLTLQQMIKRLACLSILIFMTALPLLYRSVRYRMQEIETASRFSGVKLLLARLILIGIGDICLLTGIFLTGTINTLLPADSVFFCLCFPFLLSGSVCLYMLGHLTPEKFLAGSLLFCSFLAVLFALIPGQYMVLYQPSLSAFWALLCAFLLALCVHQLRYIIKTSSYEELQLT